MYFAGVVARCSKYSKDPRRRKQYHIADLAATGGSTSTGNNTTQEVTGPTARHHDLARN
jgi:hypothetical protein